MIVGADDQERTDCLRELQDPVVLPVLAFTNAHIRLDDATRSGRHPAQKRAVGGCLPACKAESATEDARRAFDQVPAKPKLELETLVKDRQSHGRGLAADRRRGLPAFRIGLRHHSVYQHVDVDHDRDAAWRDHAQECGFLDFRLRLDRTASRRSRGLVTPPAAARFSPTSRTSSKSCQFSTASIRSIAFRMNSVGLPFARRSTMRSNRGASSGRREKLRLTAVRLMVGNRC